MAYARSARIVAAVTMAVAASVLLGGMTLHRSAAGGPPRATPHPAPHGERVTTPVTLDGPTPITLVPLPRDYTPPLTADQAWAVYTAALGHREPQVPSRLRVAVGSLSIPITDAGPEDGWTYRVHDRAAYAYSAETGCVSTLPGSPLNGEECTEWTFVDASDGNEIESTYVPISK